MITSRKNQLLLKALCISAGFFIGSLNPLYANPTGGTVVSGSATIGSTGNTTTINQSSDKAIINWNSFSIGAGETTRFNQPSASSIALNRVTGNDPSSIFGNLSANGKIMLINPNGILFGKGSNVDVAGLIATTAQIKDSDFLNGNHTFIQDANKTAGIVNEGTIKVADTGLAALVAPSVENRGIIQANLGKVVLGSGKAFTVVDTYGDNLIQFATDSELANAKVSNSGTILANGGKVLMTAKAAAGVVDNVINMDGVIEANSVTQRNGEIILSGGNHGIVKVAGTIKARGQTAGLKGGNVKINGENIKLLNNSSIDVSGQTSGGNIDIKATDTTQANGRLIAQGNTSDGGFIETSALHHLDITGIQVNTSSVQGKTGTWLLDPQDITIDTAYAANIVNNLANNNVTIQTNATSSGNGDIFINAPITWSSNHNLTLSAYRNIQFGNNSSMTNINGANVVLRADNTGTGIGTVVFGTHSNINLSGGYGCVSIYYNPQTFGVEETFYANGSTPIQYMLINQLGNQNDTTTRSLASLSNNQTLWSKNFALAKNIDASATVNWNNGQGFIPIAGIDSASLPFSGSFDGQGYAVDKLSINNTKKENAGLFGTNSGEIKNLQLTNININATLNEKQFLRIGGIAGINNGSISNSQASGNISGSNLTLLAQTAIAVGGITGLNNGYISNSQYIGNTSGNLDTSVYPGSNQTTDINRLTAVGGLVGLNTGSITNGSADGIVSGKSISGPYDWNVAYIGGLVGYNLANNSSGASIKNSYMNGTVTGISTGYAYVGGLVGYNYAPFAKASINNSYAIANVLAGSLYNQSYGGGLVGVNQGSESLIKNSYANGTVTVKASLGEAQNPGGLIGLNGNTGAITNSYWNITTSNISNAVGSGINSGITGLTTNQLMANLPTDFNDTDWAILPDQSLPYLKWQFTNTPTAISGITSVPAVIPVINNIIPNGNTKSVTLLKNGNAFDTVNITGKNGFYYKLYSNDNGNTLNIGDTLFAYIDGVSGNSIWRAATTNASASGTTSLDIALNTVTISGGSTGQHLNNSMLASAAAGAASTNRLYSVSGHDITLQNNIDFVQKAGSYYSLDGNLSSQGNGNITFNSNVSLSNDATITANKLILNGAIHLNGNDLNLVSKQFINNYGANALDITAGGHWLVWSSNTNPFDSLTGDRPNGLAYDFKQFNTAYGQAIQGTGNGLIYTYALPQLTVTLTGTVNKIYDGNNTATLTNNNYLITGAMAGDSITLTSNAFYDDKNVGHTKTVSVNNIAINNVTDSNGKQIYGYSLNSTNSSNHINGTINPRSIQITVNPATKVYGSADPVFSYVATDMVAGETLNGSLARHAGENVDSYLINQNTITNANNPNYDITFTGNHFSITPANLTIKANDISRLVGQANPSFSAEYIGLVNGDTPSAINWLTFVTNATENSPAGNYTIQPVGAMADNYNISYQNGILSVISNTKDAEKINLNNLLSVYGDAIVSTQDSIGIMLDNKLTSLLQGSIAIAYDNTNSKIFIDDSLKNVTLNATTLSHGAAATNQNIDISVTAGSIYITNPITNINTSSAITDTAPYTVMGGNTLPLTPASLLLKPSNPDSPTLPE